jgi:hypothetical protein
VSIHYFRFTRSGAVSRQRSRLLERLLARADASAAVTDWRVDAFRALAPKATFMPGVGAAALYAECGVVEGASVFMATPLHYVAEMNNVRLPADGIQTLRQSEADALAVDFNRVWHDAGIRLLAGRSAPQAPPGGGPRMGPTHLYCVADQALAATTHDPEYALDRHIENYLPTGAAAPPLRRLMSEIEMWLFDHAVNRTRIADAAAAVNGLWLWGGGPALRSLPPVDGWTAGDDPLFKAFAGPGDAPARAGSGVVVIAAEPGTDAWREAESRWLESSLADLLSGRIERLDLSAGNRCFSVRARWKWRVWRRHRPWWEFFA